VERSRTTHEPVFLTDEEGPRAAVIAVEDLAALQRAQDAVDIATCERVAASAGEWIEHSALMAMLDAEDAESA
jgi:PHD/YefM family antitoxin component YafN of YafNO toxin-antitoxin module